MDMTGIDLLTISNGTIAVRLFSEDGAAEHNSWGAD